MDIDEDFISGIIGGRSLYSWGEQHQLINLFAGDLECEYIVPEGQEIVWAAIVHYQAFHLADWMLSAGNIFTEPWAYGEECFTCVPHDASKWDEWIESRLMIPSSGVTDNFRKETIKEMVKREYIKIPLNSGLPLYYWLLGGYKREDFCELKECIEYFGNDFRSGEYVDLWSLEQVEKCLKSFMNESIRAGTAVYMVRAVFEWRPEIAEGYEKKVIVRLLENMYIKYRDRKQWLSATKIQCVFRLYRSTKRANVLRSHPDKLFSEFSVLRKRKLEIDDTRFGSVVQ